MKTKNQNGKVWVVRHARTQWNGTMLVPAAPEAVYFDTEGVETHYATESEARAAWAEHETLPEFCHGDHVYVCVDRIDLTCVGCASVWHSQFVWVCRTEGVGTWEPSYFEDGVECAFSDRADAVAFLESWDDTDSEIVRIPKTDIARQEVTL